MASEVNAKSKNIMARQQRQYLWVSIALGAMMLLALGILALTPSSSGVSVYGSAATSQIVISNAVHPMDMRVLGIKKVAPRWFVAMQPGAIKDNTHWVYRVIDEDRPVYVTGASVDMISVGLIYSGYNSGLLNAIGPGTYFLIRMSDGSVVRYDYVSSKREDRKVAISPTLQSLSISLIGEPNDQGTVPAPYRSLVEASYSGVTPMATQIKATLPATHKP